MQPYDENWIVETASQAYWQLYLDAGRVFGDDAESMIWIARTQYDICAGMAPDASLAKHSAECRAALGLPPVPEPEPGPVPAVHPLARNGLRLVRPDGTPWRCRGVTAFTAGYWLRQGDTARLEDYARWTHSIGANCWRIFCMWGSHAPSYSLNVDEVNDTAVWCIEHGIRPWLVLFTDQVEGSPVLMPKAQRAAWTRTVRERLTGLEGYVLVEEMNEPFKNGGCSVPADAFHGLLGVRGAPVDGEAQPGSVLTFCTEHTPRGDQWSRKAKNLLETRRQGGPPGAPFQCPVMAGEPEQLERATTRQYADYAALCDLFGDGMVLHGNNTRLQECLPAADNSVVASAVAQVWAAELEPSFADRGVYTRGGLGDCPLAHRDRYNEAGDEVDSGGALRTFAMMVGAEARAVVVDPGPTYALTAVNGWRVTRQRGPHGQIVDVER